MCDVGPVSSSRNEGESWEEVTTLGQLTEEQIHLYLRSLVRSFLAISKYPVLRSSCPVASSPQCQRTLNGQRAKSLWGIDQKGLVSSFFSFCAWRFEECGMNI